MTNEETVLLPNNGVKRYNDGNQNTLDNDLFSIEPTDSDLVSQQNTHKNIQTKRLLNKRHISMLSIGGIIGTGFFFGINLTLIHGPIISLLSFIYLSFLSFIIIQSVGEMSCFTPINGSLIQFQYLYLSNILGFMNNFIYWISWCITLSLELNLIFEILQFWNLEKVVGIFENQLVIILIFWIILTLFNLFPVNYYGEIEFFITLFKVGFILIWILLSIGLIFKTKIGFKNWNQDLIWGIDTIKAIKNPIGNKILNILSSLVSSCFTFQSIESIALCSGEIKNIHKTLPKTVKYIITRLIIFYILTLFLLTLMIPCNDSKLIGNNQNNIFTSPFLIGLINLGLPINSVLLSIFNFIILMSIISAANSNIYFGSRCLISMVEKGMFWSKFGNTSKAGIPYNAVLLTSILGLIPSILSIFKSFDFVFKILINLSATSGLIMWLFISISYIRFRKILHYNKLDYRNLRFNSSLNMIYLSYISIISIIIIILGNGILNLWNFNWDSFWSCYLTSIIMLVGWIILSIFWKQPLGFKPLSEVDIWMDQSPFAFKE
ncbi:LYP1 [Candida pseudojiufengensis]|uniref:LYP1 n=1 Tax=Candida pseudojiufengensis TaxID=497109 RepID=UPI0022248C89|nr:LYP1 [Candida pseudojiufengensis]KAI5962323.1 LYP1 [Candida pseudojiufengensis]